MFTLPWQVSLSTFLTSLGLVTTLTTFPVQSALTVVEKQASPQPDQELKQFDCLEVSAKGSGLYVHSEPTVYSTALGILQDGRQVIPVNNQLLGNGWLQISAPMRGYVFAGFLRPCQADLTPGECYCSLADQKTLRREYRSIQSNRYHSIELN